MPFDAGYFDQDTGDFIITPTDITYDGPNGGVNAILAKSDLPNGAFAITIDFTFQLQSASGDIIMFAAFLQSSSLVTPPTAVGGLICGFGTVGPNQRAVIYNAAAQLAVSSGFSLASPLSGQKILTIGPDTGGGFRDVNGRVIVPAHSIDINADVSNHIQPGAPIRFGFSGCGGTDPFKDVYAVNSVQIVGENLPNACPTAPSPPSITFPANGAMGVSIPVTATWTTPEGTDTFRFQMSDEITFAAPLVDATDLSSASYLLDMLELATTYHIRVLATNEVGDSDWSAIVSFTTESGAPPPPSKYAHAMAKLLPGGAAWPR
jgi:hypothetical protein